MTDAPAFVLFTDDYQRGIAACFGGAHPDWAAVCSPALRLEERQAVYRSLAAATKSLGVFFGMGGVDGEIVRQEFDRLRAAGRVNGLDAAQLKGLSDWLAKRGLRAGEPVASLLAAGCSAAQVTERAAQERMVA